MGQPAASADTPHDMERIVIGIVLASASVVTAQNVSVVPRAPAPLTASVIYGGQPFNQVMPSGPLYWNAYLGASTPYVFGSVLGAHASMHWTTYTPNTLLRPEFDVNVGFNGNLTSHIGPATATLGPNEMIFDVSATTQRDAFLDIELTGSFTGASQWPVWEVDVGDNGTADAYLGNGVASVPMQLGPLPVPIVVRCAVGIGAPNSVYATSAFMHGNLEMRLTADNNLIIDEVAAGCGGGILECRQAFAHDGVVFNDAGGSSVKVLVLGTQPTPFVFTNAISTCVLWPSPDVVLAQIGTLDLPIPATVRPFQFYAQSVYLGSWFGPNVYSSQALRISAF